MNNIYSLIILLYCFIAFPLHAETIKSIDEVLYIAETHSDALKSIDLKIKSLWSEIRSRDLELSGVISTQISAVNDDRENINNNQQVNSISPNRNKGKYGALDTMYTKPFETGTELMLGINHNHWDSVADQYGTNQAGWQIRLSQALWRNSFGVNTNFRRKAEQFEQRSRFIYLISERQLIKQNIEHAIWDLILARQKKVIVKKNLDSSQRLYKWIQNRVNKFAAEEVDKIQVETLVAERQLDLIMLEDAEQNAINRIKELIPFTDPNNWQFDLNILQRSRSLNSLFADVLVSSESDNVPVHLDVLVSRNRAEQLLSEASRLEDTLDPDLSAFIAYGANSSNDNFAKSWEDSIEANSNIAQVGLLFSVQLDSDLKKESLNSVKYSANAERLRTKALEQQSNIAWKELNRNIASLNKQIAEAKKLTMLQTEKVALEKKRYEQGRSTTFQLVSFELDASSSEIRLYSLVANLRQAENKARSYILANK